MPRLKHMAPARSCSRLVLALEAGKKRADVGVILAEWNEFRPVGLRPGKSRFGLRLLEHKKAVSLSSSQRRSCGRLHFTKGPNTHKTRMISLLRSSSPRLSF